MWKKIKTIVIVAVVMAVGWLLLAHHIIFTGDSLKILKKVNLTNEYTFFSIHNKDSESIMVIDKLREAGIGDLLVQTGAIDEKKKQELDERFSNDSVYY
ncbi:MAG: hypothetical protein GY859_00600 [Desulfobacterales bacterium]|nr:hypothetical protein [Desulfobacterales bacterium]